LGSGFGSPRGTVWQGSGTGPDRAFRFQVDAAMTLTATMLSTADLGLYLFSSTCTSQLSSCACVSDNSFANQFEIITDIQAVPGVDYFLVVDGFVDPSLGGGPSQGPFDLTILRTACGNSIAESGEACDDGNTEDCDGCRADCSAQETGCGDGFECDPEQCDDGNGNSEDGCSSTCEIEPDVVSPDGGGSSEPDASTSNGGTSGEGGEGNEAGNGNGAGSGNDPDGNDGVDGGGDGVGGNAGAAHQGGTFGNPGKGGNRAGAGGTAGAVSNSAASDGNSGGCSTTGHPAPSSTWFALLTLIALATKRRRNA
jgi:MYXO-CTERM domain-containing protein